MASDFTGVSKTALLLALGMMVSNPSYANPEDGVVASGSADISAQGTKLNITQNSNKVVIDWRSFDIAPDEHTQFYQPNSNSIALNRINSANPSQILGKLTANGNIILVNPSGIVFGKDSKVDVNGLVATTSNISTSDFATGKMDFVSGGNSGATIINEGTITAKEAGLVGLVAPNVKNNGVIEAKLGKVQMASATQFSVDMYGDGLINLAVDDSVTHQVIENKGRVSAEGGTIQLTAASGAKIVNSLVNAEGELTTASVTTKGGKIIISNEGAISNTGLIDSSGTDGGEISVSGNKILQQGKLKASGKTGAGGNIAVSYKTAYLDNEKSSVDASGNHGKGGNIAVKGKTGSRAFISGTYNTESLNDKGGQVDITSENGDLKLFGAQVNADGKLGGGRINIGGEYQGGGSLAHTKTTSINFATTLSANATQTGDGGSVVVWSDDTTLFGGKAYALGGAISGNGGLVEVSSKDTMKIAGNAVTKASAVNGAAGSVLFDPKNITVATGGLSGGISSFELVDPNINSPTFGSDIRVLSTGNILVTDFFDSFAASNAGAVYLYNGATGALISKLTGSQAGDTVGANIVVLANGNFVVGSGAWDNGAAADAGAVTWGNGTTGVAGVVSSSNSLVGSQTNDRIGDYNITALTNGNYIVGSVEWDNGAVADAGAVTWGNGTTGTTGVVSTANSLVGSQASDRVGEYLTALSNGNYVVSSATWDNGSVLDAGAVTWGNGTSGTVGVVSAANSLVGSQDYDSVGGVRALKNGNYVVTSYQWDNGAVSNAGAATWGNGTTGVSGVISAANSLVGTSAGDSVGSEGVYELANGNYIVSSKLWNNGAATEAGASTWGDGSVGIVGAVSSANSIVGSQSYDHIGNSSSIAELTNGNYIVKSHEWDNGAVSDAGAVTWVNGATGTSGIVSAANSLIGTQGGDQVGFGSTVLSNGNYVVVSKYWNNGAAVAAGAVTWGNGATGTFGAVSAANSLVGSHNFDQIGSNGEVGSSGVIALTNGNYVVTSYSWDNGAATDAGAVTWGSGTSGVSGVVSAANSLVGDKIDDSVGYNLKALSNGNYVVSSRLWGNGAATQAGAVTWGNGATGITGVVSSSNSLVGTQSYDEVGVSAILSNGNYVVGSTGWDNASVADVGFVKWVNGTTGATGVVDASSAFVGTQAGDRIGSAGVLALANGNYAFGGEFWDDGASADAGFVTVADGSSDLIGSVNSSNSFIGSGSGLGGVYLFVDDVNDRAIARFEYTTGNRIFSVSGNTGSLSSYDSYADSASGSVTLDPTFITNILNAGSNVTLQASNDITITNAIIANNGSGNGGTFTLQAGRSILINDDITTDNGDLNILANENLATGVVNGQRDAGAAVITMASGATLDAGTGNVLLRINTGAGKTNATSGDMTLSTINGNTITALNEGTSGDVILNHGSLNAASAGDSIILSSRRNFINNIGAGALNAGAGRWLAYSTSPAANTLGGLVSGFTNYSCTYGGACGSLGAGNGFLYSSAAIAPAPTPTPSAAVVPATVLYVSQVPVTQIVTGLDDFTLASGTSIGLSAPNTNLSTQIAPSSLVGGASSTVVIDETLESAADGEFVLETKIANDLNQLFNGWISIDPELVRELSLLYRKI